MVLLGQVLNPSFPTVACTAAWAVETPAIY